MQPLRETRIDQVARTTIRVSKQGNCVKDGKPNFLSPG
jgi:hypothetical protein